jgi:hypothetical protein
MPSWPTGRSSVVDGVVVVAAIGQAVGIAAAHRSKSKRLAQMGITPKPD